MVSLIAMLYFFCLSVAFLLLHFFFYPKEFSLLTLTFSHRTDYLLGMVSCWTVDGKTRPSSSFSNSTQHRDAITVLEWNPAGKRIITGDKKGVVVVWSVDSRGGLSPMRQYKKKGEITSAIFCLAPLKLTLDSNHATFGGMRGAKGEMVKTNNQSPSFFFGTDRGVIAYADDMGHCSDVQQLSSSIDTMMFFEERSRLIIITRSLLLTQYHVADDGKVSRVNQVKLSVPGDIAEKGIKSVVWAGPGLLAAATEERMLRLFDLAADESYNISLLSALGAIVDRSDRLLCVSFSPVDRYLAIGTEHGLIVMWRFIGQARDFGSSHTGNIAATVSSDWELIFRISLSTPILQLAWHGGKGTLGAVTEDGAVVLNESKMNAIMCGETAVAQTSSHEVSVHIGGSPHPIIINTELQVRGLAVGRTCFVVWSGKQARVYKVDLALQKVEPMPRIPSAGISMAIADTTFISDDAWFVCEAGSSAVKILNFAGTQKGSVTFSEVEGVPEHLDVNGKYLAVVTSKGYVKIVDVHSPTKPRMQGSVGQLFGVKPSISSGIVSNGADAAAAAAADKKSNKGSSDEDFGSNLKIRSIKVNSTGTRVAVLVDTVEGALKVCHPDPRLFVYDRSKGSVSGFDFSSMNRKPISVFWDDMDDRLVSCEAEKVRSLTTDASKRGGANTSLSGNVKGGGNSDEEEEGKRGGGGEGKDGEEEKSAKLTNKASIGVLGTTGAANAASAAEDAAEDSEVEVFLFFATTEHGILMQDSFPRKHPYGAMMGLSVPRLYFRSGMTSARRKDDDNDDGNDFRAEVDLKDVKIYSKVMRDFIGMDDVTEHAKAALLDFSYNITLGHLDEAYKAVKAIDSPNIWENMAQMCVKTKRLDVAEVCLGNMGHARGAAAVRESKLEDSPDVSVAVLAVQLGLLDDAARLFREAGRHDKLNKLYQAAGLWDKAIACGATNDRIHLKTTHYQYAKHLESLGQIDNAIEHFELSENARTEVPRMLFHLGRVDDLGEYVMKSDDKQLLKWWAAYLESVERFDKAMKYYNKAKDYQSLVRICCFKGDFNKAADIVHESGDKASAYHFARQLESQGEYQEAINFYAASGCYNHSIRLARAYNLDAELMRYAVKSTPSLMIECGAHFEAKGEIDKAVQLYHKGGDIPRALDLCFRMGDGGGVDAGQSAMVFDLLNAVAQDLGAASSPQTLARCAEFLVQHKQFDKAIELYVLAKRPHAAVEMCLQHKVTINDDMVETLTPPDTMESSERKEILLDLAKALKKQGSFTLASKKYTQAGDRVRAIKCLVRGGDTKAVIQFASISRNAEIYKLAANYLQQMNWRESVDIMKAIINFYTRAKAFVQLAGFYDSCAQVEIDEYRDYGKAIGALREALKYLGKDNSRQTEDMAAQMQKRVTMIEKFVEARQCQKSDPAKMVSICQALLQEPMLEEAIRAGDCLAMLIEHYHGQVCQLIFFNELCVYVYCLIMFVS